MTASLDEAALRHWLIDYLVTNIGCSPNDINFEASLKDLGVASRDAVVLSGELSELLDRPVSPIEFWQHPTINALARFLTGSEPDSNAETVLDHDRHLMDEPIAVIGLGCRFPGDILGPEAFWQFLCEGRSAVGEVSAGSVGAVRRRLNRSGRGAVPYHAMGFVLRPTSRRSTRSSSKSRRAKPPRWIPSSVCCWRWPTRRWRTPVFAAESLRQTQTGVFVGACAGEYGYLTASDLSQVDAWSGTGGALSIIANRLSYFFDLRGPSVTVDTACSSSLVAVHLACQSLRTGDSNLAIAAGVNLLLSPAITCSFDQAEAMSPTGQCHAFDASADGFVRGEGCGVVVLKRLTDALARRRSGVGGGARFGSQSGRPVERADGAQSGSADGGAARRLRQCRRRATPGRLCRGAWHRHAAWRSHRSAGARNGCWAAHAPRALRC